LIKKNKKKFNEYDGWELKHFDKSYNFRNYQFKLFNKYIKGSIAEIGPGRGGNLIYYLDKANKIDLYEPSKEIYFQLRNRFRKYKKINFYNKVFKSKKKYDSILYMDVLEHIKYDRSEIINALNSVKKNGYLIINVPAFSHLYSEFDEDVGHYRRYSKSDFKKILKKVKFQKTSYVYYDSVGYFLSLLSKIFLTNYNSNFDKKIKFWNSLMWLSIILDKIFINSFGKSLFVFIKK
jgi:hypothetical protein